jgi:hypothetical protein
MNKNFILLNVACRIISGTYGKYIIRLENKYRKKNNANEQKK